MGLLEQAAKIIWAQRHGSTPVDEQTAEWISCLSAANEMLKEVDPPEEDENAPDWEIVYSLSVTLKGDTSDTAREKADTILSDAFPGASNISWGVESVEEI